MHIAFTLPGGFPIYSSALLIGLGATTGLMRAARATPLERQTALVSAGLWSLWGGLIGGRLGYVIFHWSYFQSDPLQIPAISDGGLSWAGAMVGGLFALWLAAGRKTLVFAIFADTLMPVLTGVTVASWLGCWLDGCAYGLPTDGWWGLAAVDEWGVLGQRWPVQLTGAILAILLLWALEANKERMTYPGQAASLGLATLGIQFFSLTYMRGDAMPVRYGLRMDAWTALLMIAFGLFSLKSINRANSL